MSSQPIPILVTGKGEPVGRVVIDTLQPEYEVIHFTLASAVKEELPLLLTNKPPANPSSTLGTGHWSADRPPQALLLGGAYQDADIESLTALVGATEGAVQIPWLRVDTRNKAPPLQQPTEAELREYGMDVARRMKEMLGQLGAEGKLGPGNGRVYLV
ncbi:hypothetical protein M406DRAFT_355759 [Cryphonectria parasitica EP155]|uniref:Uncharacterized protein n=1 Tax=Cryphonectria parasitica (strain ATCC 38755 / EP155) TaxID=660469 RepID=A0A9P5CR58_CRYP1|nr:uncharacterized protein M406DRAFT_355759 [Cryphonectria parasitica EP155]KAF3767913.1 hypothetical protein M406DRAFT_355759 [Cryphonectria parasitica EP155]